MNKTKSQKCWGKLSGNLLALPPPPILNKVESELTHSCSVKTIKKVKYRFHWFIVCSVEVTCIVTVIILQNMILNIKSAVFTYGEYGKGNSAVELACLQMLNISLHKIYIYFFAQFKVGIIPVLTNKNQPTNLKYLQTYIEWN